MLVIVLCCRVNPSTFQGNMVRTMKRDIILLLLTIQLSVFVQKFVLHIAIIKKMYNVPLYGLFILDLYDMEGAGLKCSLIIIRKCSVDTVIFAKT